MRSAQASVRSSIHLLSPYGEPGSIGAASVIGTVSGVPNGAAVEDSTKRGTPWRTQASISAMPLHAFSSR